MALNENQTKRIDDLIVAGKKKADIVDDLVRSFGAGSREVDAYLAENRTVQGALNIITRHAKDLIPEGEEARRRRLVGEIEKEAKRAIKMLRDAAK